VIRTLGSLGANLTEESDDEATVMEIAASSGKLVTIRLLGSLGASVDGGVTSLLYMAAKQGHASAVRLPVSIGADSNEAKENGRTPLMIAAASGHVSILRYLVQLGSDVNRRLGMVRRRFGERPRTIAMRRSEGWCRFGGIMKVPDKRGRTALMPACTAGRKTTVQLLATLGAGLNVVADQGSALCMAARDGHEATVRAPLSLGADVDCASKWGESALYLAARLGHEPIVRVLHSFGAEGCRRKSTARRH
jgi:ankyrin repeat protein